MTSRRGTLVEEGARELLQIQGYTVQIIPVGFNKRYPPAHLVASRGSGETRFIRIRKISHVPFSIKSVESHCSREIVQLRRHLSCHPGDTGLHGEIWIYSLCYGFRSYEVLTDCVREISPHTFRDSFTPPAGDAA